MKIPVSAKIIVKGFVRSFVRIVAAFPATRKVLNKLYLSLGPSARSRFHGAFSKIFREGSLRGRNGTWEIVFANKAVYMPLDSESFWLDWDSAVSIVGHDIEVKVTYETLLMSENEKPELFIDVGANYGTHSLLFLVHNVNTISFEPNAECQSNFRAICDLNRVTPSIENVALGAHAGSTEIAYPKRDTWLGSTNPRIIERLSRSDNLIRQDVIQKTLDQYLPLIAKHRTLIKIDTEGNELAVLRGAVKVLQNTRPTLIFESLRDDSRHTIYDFLISQCYSISTLPYNPLHNFQPLTRDQFVSHSATNFVARPSGKSAASEWQDQQDATTQRSRPVLDDERRLASHMAFTDEHLSTLAKKNGCEIVRHAIPASGCGASFENDHRLWALWCCSARAARYIRPLALTSLW